MNSKTWIKKALSMCLVAAIMATCSMFTLANGERIAGELTVSSKNSNTPAFVLINGESAQSGRSFFSSSTIATPENAGAVLDLGKAGKIQLAPNTTLALNFNEKTVSGELMTGQISVLSSSEAVSIKTANGTTAQLNAGDSATAVGKAQDDDDTTTGGGGSSWIIWAMVLGGAAAGIIIASTTDNNRVSVGGGSTVISPTR